MGNTASESNLLLLFGVVNLKENNNTKDIVFTAFLSICLFAIIFGGINAVILNQDNGDKNDSLSVQAVINSGLSLNADVEWKYYYTKCGHTETITTKPAE